MSQHPWIASYQPGINWEFSDELVPVHTLFERTASLNPERTCTNFMGALRTYGDIYADIEKCARALQDAGIKKGDTVAICLPNTPYFVVAYYAALKVGAKLTNINPLYTADEIEYQVKDAQVKLIFTINVEVILDKVLKVQEEADVDKVIVCDLTKALPPVKSFLFKLFKGKELKNPEVSDKVHTYETFLAVKGVATTVDINPQEDIALLQYTGGTTGLPKGAMLTHANVCANTLQIVKWMPEINKEGEKFLCVLPFFHVFSMTVNLNLSVLTGSEMILLPRFVLDTVIKTIDKEQPTIFPSVPTIFTAISNHPKVGNYDLSSIKFCISGGAALPQAVRDDFIKHTGCKVVEGYGLSEASPVTNCNPLHTGGKIGSIGVPLPGTQVEIRDQNNPQRKVELGERGEICIKGPQVMKGYWRREEATNDALIDGWLRTGDVGYMDKEGFVFLTDRIKDIIISGGYNVYPRMIEEAFYKHPEVDEVTVIGIPHDVKGETPKAFVKLKASSMLTEEQLLAFAAENLNPIEKPTEVEIRDELPKTLIGKLSKKELVEEEAQKRRKK